MYIDRCYARYYDILYLHISYSFVVAKLTFHLDANFIIIITNTHPVTWLLRWNAKPLSTNSKIMQCTSLFLTFIDTRIMFSNLYNSKNLSNTTMEHKCTLYSIGLCCSALRRGKSYSSADILLHQKLNTSADIIILYAGYL